MILLDIFDYIWFEHHFLYFSGIILLVILFLVIKIIISLNKDIKRMDRKTKNFMIDYMRKTSKYNKDKEKLSFDEED